MPRKKNVVIRRMDSQIVRGVPFHHDACQDLKADYIPIQSALQHERLGRRAPPGGQAPEVWLAVTRKYATSVEEI